MGNVSIGRKGSKSGSEAKSKSPDTTTTSSDLASKDPPLEPTVAKGTLEDGMAGLNLKPTSHCKCSPCTCNPCRCGDGASTQDQQPPNGTTPNGHGPVGLEEDKGGEDESTAGGTEPVPTPQIIEEDNPVESGDNGPKAVVIEEDTDGHDPCGCGGNCPCQPCMCQPDPSSGNPGHDHPVCNGYLEHEGPEDNRMAEIVNWRPFPRILCRCLFNCWRDRFSDGSQRNEMGFNDYYLLIIMY